MLNLLVKKNKEIVGPLKICPVVNFKVPKLLKMNVNADLDTELIETYFYFFAVLHIFIGPSTALYKEG